MAGPNRACALQVDGTVTCWGWTYHLTPTGTFVDLSGRWDHSCALAPDGTVTCWNDPVYICNPAAEDIPPGTYARIEAGGDYTCALHDDGSLVSCWWSWEPDTYYD